MSSSHDQKDEGQVIAPTASGEQRGAVEKDEHDVNGFAPATPEEEREVLRKIDMTVLPMVSPSVQLSPHDTDALTSCP